MDIKELPVRSEITIEHMIRHLVKELFDKCSKLNKTRDDLKEIKRLRETIRIVRATNSGVLQ